MRLNVGILLGIAALFPSTVNASAAFPGLEATSISTLNRRPIYRRSADGANMHPSIHELTTHQQTVLLSHRHTNNHRSASGHVLAMAIPGYGVAEQVFVGGFANFLSIYNTVITARILLSWFPQAQGIGALQPVYAVTDPYLNLFRGIIPPIFGLDLSPILAFVTLNLLSSATASVGAEIPQELKEKIQMKKKFQPTL